MMATPLFTLACVGLGTVGVGLILKLTVTWGNHQIVKKDKEAKRLASIRADLLNRKDRAIKALLEERDINPILSMISYFTTEHRWGASEAEEVALALGEIGSPLGIPLLTHLTHSSAYRVTVPSNYIGIGMDPTRPENIALIGALLKKELGLHARNPQAFNREAIARAQRSARCALYRIR